MQFAFTEEQELLRREARQALDGGRQPDFAELGWTSAGLREAGLGFVEEAVLYEELGRAGQGEAFFDAVVAARPPDQQLAALALEAVGIAQKALELALEHASNREQFGRKIGAYQAVSHKLADTYVETELARSLAYWAAWCVAEGEEIASVATAAAKSYAGEAAVAACERSIQVHGGIGFTWEHVLHRYYERALWIQSYGGYPRKLRAQVAAWLLDRR
jgi:alkylation response protein AidB-like acyl-CoA dehydrogenase